MKRTSTLLLLVALLCTTLITPAFAEMEGTTGEITGRTVCAGLLSFLIWPGIGQYMNECETDKNWTHALLGITGIFRFWSGWDALVERKGGYWKDRI